MRFVHTFTTMILIFALYIVDFTPNAILISEARAEEADAATTANLNSMVASTVSKSEQEKIDEANGTKEASKQKTGTSKNIDDENMLLNLTALAAAFVTTTMIVQCTPIGTDMYAASGAGALWIVGETMAAMKFKKAMKDLEGKYVEEYSTKREDVEKQITVLSLLRSSYMDAKEIIEAKIKMQNVAVLGYSAAAVIAFIMSYTMLENAKSIFTNCAKTDVTKWGGIVSNENKMKGTNPFLYFSNIFYSSFLKEAKAGSSPFWFLGGAGAYAIWYMIKGAEAAQFAWIKQPFSRGLAYLATVLLLTMALNKTKDTLGEIEANIAKLDVIIAKLNFLAKGGLGRKLQEKEYKVAKTNLTPKAIQVSENTSEKTICATGGTMGACPSVAGALITSPDFSNLPDSMKSLSTTIGKVADSVGGQNVISSSALSTVDALNSKAATVGKALTKKAYELNNGLNKKTKKNNDLDKLTNKLAQRMKKNALTGYQKAGGQMNSAVADFMKDGSNLNGVKLGEVGANTKKPNANQAPVTASGAGKGSEFDFDFKEETTGASESEGAMASAGVNLDEYETGNAEVHPDAKKNIFDIISGRYIKSGYPRLLEEEL